MPIAESRNHAKRILDRAMAKGSKKKQVKNQVGQCHALNAGYNAAFEENQAEERHVRKNQHVEEFRARVNRRMIKKEELNKIKKDSKNMIFVSALRLNIITSSVTSSKSASTKPLSISILFISLLKSEGGAIRQTVTGRSKGLMLSVTLCMTEELLF